ncbi:hypothetical protein FA10DRAFT_268871 [Acaromyces ingoldii]|uniref:Uncharacterized protein n=1 Tax=Acaromyces ingoldii TaxID=215250 RepID=A0A316YI07_9BASI|nr:hypothetical protein FA10DRAFT_268871 [Acaromyces ingoldii]PWN88706.1 hypothetical protein FA10DRAFT_268871 [Acaromyces ingoldii]
MPPRPRMSLGDLAQRATVTGLVGMGIWGLWLTGAVWKSRRGDDAIHGTLGPSPEVAAREAQMRDALEERLQRQQDAQKINPPPLRPS